MKWLKTSKMLLNLLVKTQIKIYTRVSSLEQFSKNKSFKLLSMKNKKFKSLSMSVKFIVYSLNQHILETKPSMAYLMVEGSPNLFLMNLRS